MHNNELAERQGLAHETRRRTDWEQLMPWHWLREEWGRSL